MKPQIEPHHLESNQMPPEQQRSTIAEACPKLCFKDADGQWRYRVGTCQISYFDPLTDLNAMHAAEAVLTAEQCNRYNAELFDIKRPYNKTLSQHERWTWGSSAAQRAEAFLRTLTLWP